MLNFLRIKDLVLVDSCELSFSPHFNVITGETGAGKSTLLTAIGLLLGEKADLTLIRHGKKTAFVEGEFTKPSHPLLEELGIEGERIVLRREIHSSGRSRTFINDHLVPVGTLKQIGSSLIEISNQHAGLTLKKPSTPLQMLDQFSSLSTSEFSICYGELKRLQEQKELLLRDEPLRHSKIEQIQQQLDEISSSHVFETDDNALFSRLTEIEETREIHEKGGEALSLLDTAPLVSALKTMTSPLFSNAREHLEIASNHISEAINEINRLLGTIEIDSFEHEKIEEQLQKIDRIHRRYGKDPSQIQSAKDTLEESLQSLCNRESELFELDEQIKNAMKECDTIASQLTIERSQAAALFSAQIQALLPTLNMPHALFEVEIVKKERTSTGDDQVAFFITPNIGEKRIELHEHASGGELARLFLAIQSILADQSSIPTILFDEIDASIGGMTANTVGKALAAMGQKRQVLAVTHFVQVASQATSHFTLQKKTLKGRTLTTVEELNSKKQIEKEHLRMIGTRSGV